MRWNVSVGASVMYAGRYGKHPAASVSLVYVLQGAILIRFQQWGSLGDGCELPGSLRSVDSGTTPRYVHPPPSQKGEGREDRGQSSDPVVLPSLDFARVLHFCGREAVLKKNRFSSKEYS